MKKIAKIACGLLTLFIAVPESLYAQNGVAASQRNSGNYTVTERGADYAIHQKTTVEHGTNRIHRYIQLETGLNYTNSYGQLVESKKEIDVLPQGGAAATQGRHKAYFPGDIYSGQIEVVTPDGLHLKSRPLGLSYFDGTNSVLIAELTNSIGVLVSSNQVIYPNAFTDFAADLRYTYTKAGFEQDVVLKEQPPSPESFGLDSKYTRLQLLTEFFDTTDPAQTAKPVSQRDGLRDTTLTFGKMRKMKMMQGKAFSIGDQESARARGIPVYKSWQHLEGRTFLVEELPVATIAAQLDQLPLTARNEKPETGNLKSAASGLRSQSSRLAFAPSLATRHSSLILPPLRPVQASTVQLAKADMNYKSAVVLDYDEVDENQDDPFTFQAGQTYYISGYDCFFNDITFEAGTVVKYARDSDIVCTANEYCDTSVDAPAILTAVDDDTVGETIDGISTGTPSGYYADGYIIMDNGDWIDFHDLQIKYAASGMTCDANIFVHNCQFINAGNAISTWGEAVKAYNDLFYDVDTVFSASTIDAEQITAHNVNSLGSYVAATNSLFVAVTNFGTGFTGDHVASGDNSDEIFGLDNADHYLAPSSPYRNAGTTGIDALLLAHLHTMTTYAPENGGYPDNDTPDLGYHYFVNEDSDSDGLPDWWEWYYFGTTGLSDTNLDSVGQPVVDDYQNGVDPNIIFFSLQFPSEVQASATNGAVVIFGGQPSYETVLVNDTNTADAVWQPYTGTNVPVSLNSGNGIYNVSVGLRGLPPDATPTWLGTRLTLNTVAPVLSVTNPTSGTVSTPMIQLQGIVNESLSKLTFDVSNAVGVVTNQTGYWQPVFYDTNLLDFTTNTFQCYDIPLTNGVNVITLHATDMACNTTVMNFSYTLSYAGVTNAPTLSVLWPTNNTLIGGSNVTIQAQVSDATATVMASVNGSTVQGLIERSGLVWLQNVPLNSGTNVVVITAASAAGKVSTNTLDVVESSVNLTIDPISDDQLNQTNVTVTGSVSDPAADVWVNGMEVNWYDDNDWYADNVPVSPTGTATVTVEAGTDLSHIIASQTLDQVQPPLVAAASYSDEEEDYAIDEDYHVPDDFNTLVHWTAGSGGEMDEWGHGADGHGSDERYYDTAEPLSAGGLDYPWMDVQQNTALENGYFRQSTQTKVMILPSGQQAIGQTALYLVLAQVVDEDSGLQLAANAVSFMHQLAGTADEDVTNSDGSVWTEAVVSGAAGAQTEVTPIAAGNIDYTGMKVSPSKLIYFSVNPDNVPTTFDTNAVQKALQSQLSGNVFTNLQSGQSVQIKVHVDANLPATLGWHGNPKYYYVNRVNFGWSNVPFGKFAINSGDGDIEINLNPIVGMTIPTQTWVNYFAHEGIWGNVTGNKIDDDSQGDHDIASGHQDYTIPFTATSHSRLIILNACGLKSN